MLLQITAALLQITAKTYEILWQKIFQVTVPLLQTKTESYYKLHQKFIKNYDCSCFPKLLVIITNCVNVYCKLLQFSKLLEITSGFINCVVTLTPPAYQQNILHELR